MSEGKWRGPITLFCESRRFRWTIIAAVLMAALYVVSFGPACWLCNCGCLEARPVWLLYRPVTLLWDRAPRPFSAAIEWWGDVIGQEHRESEYGWVIPEPLIIESGILNPLPPGVGPFMGMPSEISELVEALQASPEPDPGMSEEWEDLERPAGYMESTINISEEPDPLTTFIIAALAIAFVAFCIWLTVRIVNRRERWAKRLGVATLIVALLGYPLSFGPACWLASRQPWPSRGRDVVVVAYAPLLGAATVGSFDRALQRYALFGSADGSSPALSESGQVVWFLPFPSDIFDGRGVH